MANKKYMTFRAINETGIEGSSYIEDGLKVETASPFKRDRTKTNPEELFGLAFATCLNSSLRFVIEQQKLNLKSRVVVEVDLMFDETSKSYYFDVYAYGSIEHLTLDEIKPLLDLAHNRCSISKLIKNSTHVSVIANLYHEKEKGA